jgi:amphi-Trp domain-containing protein
MGKVTDNDISFHHKQSSMTEKIFRSEQKLSRKEIAEHLRGIADGVEDGNVSLKSGNDSVALQPAETSELEIEVEKERDGDLSLEIEIEWNEEKESESLEIG